MYRTIQDVKQANQQAGGYWFSPGAMRFFNSRVLSKIVADGQGGAYFVSSERLSFATCSQPRRYTLHYCNAAGEVDTVGDFNVHKTAKEAWKFCPVCN